MTASEYRFGADEPLSDVDSLVWSLERDPRLRSTIVAVAVLDGPVEQRALRHRIERASRMIRRLRQHVVAPPAALTSPRWQIDPDFHLSFHLRSTTLGGRGDRRALYDLTAEIADQPFDRARPLWEVTHVHGLASGEQALILKSHHAISDGVGGVELAYEIFDLAAEPDPDRAELPARPVAGSPQPCPDLDSVLRYEARAMLSAAGGGLGSLATAVEDPEGAAYQVGRLAGSVSRQLGRPRRADHPMAGRCGSLAVDAFTVDLEDLRRAGRRVGGTINDAFVAAVVLGVSAHHRRHGVSRPRLRIGIPVDRRTPGTGSPAVGNHWVPGRLELEAASDAPDAVMALVRDHMRRLRREPTHDLLLPLAGVLRRLPAAVTTPAVVALAAGVDVAASNVPGSPVPLHLLGRRVAELIPFGPLSGAASNVTLLSHADQAHIGVGVDPAAVPDRARFVADIRNAFERLHQ